MIPNISICRGCTLRLEGERYIDGWIWRYTRRGFTIRIGDTLILVALGEF